MAQDYIHPDYQLPPILDMDPTAQTIFTAITALLAIWAGIHLFLESRRHQTALPIFLFFGGGLAVIFEPLLDLIMMCTYAHNGAWVYLELWNRQIPIFEGLTYFFYFPVTIWYFYKKFLGEVSAAELWKMAAGLYLAAAAFETIPLHLGLWSYFGGHPLQIFRVPLLLIVIGPVFIMGPAFVLWLLRERLKGSRSALALLLMPLLIAAFGLSAVMPYSAGMHVAPESWLAKYIGGIGTVIASFTFLWLIIETRTGQNKSVESQPID